MPSRFEISDELWAEIEPLIPVRERRRRYPGRKALPDRQALNGILHVLQTGPGSRPASGRRKLLVKLNAAGKIDWSRAAADSSLWGA